MGDAGIDAAKELLSPFNALLNGRISISSGRVAVKLRRVEHGIPSSEEQP